MIGYVFPGQGSQAPGMGLNLYNDNVKVQQLFHKADEILGFELSKIMFEGTDEELKRTDVTQPAVFLHSVAAAVALDNFAPDMVAGHSLGEFSALVASGAVDFEDGLKLVAKRAGAMQQACTMQQGTMAAIIGMEDAKVEEICASTEGIVIPANYNCDGQLVISGELSAVQAACEAMKAAGARKAVILQVGGAFHSPLMEPAREALAEAIEKTIFKRPICPVYQNVDAKPHIEPNEIKENLLKQLSAPVLWKESVRQMVADGATQFCELGPGKVLSNLIKKIAPEAELV